MAQLNFDARQVDPQQSFEPIPAGWYNMMIVESEMKPTSNGQGAYLQLSLKVVDGQYAGRPVFDRLNLQNQNPVARFGQGSTGSLKTEDAFSTEDQGFVFGV